MAKPEWGIKRTCLSCGARFYDLRKSPIECPSCHATFEPEAFVKTRRGRPTTADAEAKARKAAAAAKTEKEEEEEEELPELEGEDLEDVGDEEEEDETVLEDASDLGEDDDDMAEVIENVEEEET